MRKKQEQSSDDQAQSLLDELGITTIPVPVDRIAKSLGAQLRYSPLDEELSGMIFVKDGTPIIGVNAVHHPHRQRFTIAHEIAHLRLHRDLLTAEVHVDKQFQEAPAGRIMKRDSLAATGTDEYEIEANEFAAALLIPRAKLEEMLKATPIDIVNEGALDTIAKKFKVSRYTLDYRMRKLASRK
jgi:Zn-dependent peptidase ImmA (M78 family)